MNRIYLVAFFIVESLFSCVGSYGQVDLKADTISKANMRNRRGVSRLISSNTHYIRSKEAICRNPILALYGERGRCGVIEITLEKLHLDNSWADLRSSMRVNPTARAKKRVYLD